MYKKIATICLLTVFMTQFTIAQFPSPKLYENWPSNDLEWNALTNHILWCYNSLRDRECVATGSTNLGWEVSLICPFRDYTLIAQEIDRLAPYFVNHTLAGNGDFNEYLSTTNCTGMCPSDFPRWTPVILHSNAFGRTDWSTNSALTSWMTVTNRAFIAEVTAAINMLKWTARRRSAYVQSDTEEVVSWSKSADVLISRDTFTDDCSELRSAYSDSFYSGADHSSWRGILEVEIYDETWWYPQGHHLTAWSEYKYGISIDPVADGEGFINNSSFDLGVEGNPYVFNPQASVFIRREIYWSGYTPSPAVFGRKKIFFCEHFSTVSQDTKLVTYANPIAQEALQLDPLNYSEINNLSVYLSPFVPVRYSESIDYILCVMKWTFAEFPQNKLPSATPAETPDMDLDGIVEIMSTEGLPGAETGTFIVNSADESPILYLPLSFEVAWPSALMVKAYLSQGANNKLPYHFMPWIRRGYDGAMEMPVCKFPFMGLNTFHYNLNTCILEFNILTNAQTHIKQATILRPRGEVVVFDFPWNGTSFSTNGYPIGINRDRGYVLYHDRHPNSNEDLKSGVMNLLFPSGIGHTFGEGRWTSFSLPTPITGVFNDDGMSSPYSAQPGEWFDDEFRWQSTAVTQELAAVTGCVYRTTVEWKKGLPTQVTYHSITTGELCEKITFEYTDGRVTRLDKIDPVAESKIVAGNSVLYGTGVKQVRTQAGERKTGRTVAITTLDSEGATTPYLTETITYDTHQRLSNGLRTAGGRSTSYNYTYKNESAADQRYPETGLLVRNSVDTSMRTGSFGSVTESYNYTPQKGWPSLISCSVGGGETKESVMGYYSASEIVQAIPLNCPKVPLRGISLKYTEQKLNGNSYGKVFNSSTNSSTGNVNYTKMSEVCHKSDSLRGDPANQSHTNSFCVGDVTFVELLPGGYSWHYWHIIYPSYYKSPSSEQTVECYIPSMLTNVITEMHFDISDDSTYKSLHLNARGVPLYSKTMTKEGATLEESVTYVDERGRPENTYFMDGTSVHYISYCIHGPRTIFNRDYSITTIEYDPFGRVKKRVDGETGITYDYEYDPNGSVLKQTCTAGTLKAESVASYGLDGELLYSKDESGHEVTITGQSNNGYLVRTRTETGLAPVTETYWADGVLKSVTGSGAPARFTRERGVTNNKYWIKTVNPDNPSEWSTQWHEYNGLYAYTEQPGGVTNAVAYDAKLRPKADVSADKVKSLAAYDAKYPGLLSVSGVSLSGSDQINLTSDPYCVSNSYAFTSQGLKTTQYSYPEDNSAAPFEEGYTQVSPDGRTGTFCVQGRTGTFSCDAAPSTGTYKKTVNLPGGGIATSTYSKFLLREETMQEAGTLRKVTKTYQYDKFNRMETYTTDERGFKETIKVTRDPAKGLVSNINSSSQGSISIDRENNLVKKITAPSGTTTFGWKGNGSIDNVRQDSGPTFSRTEDAFGRDKSLTRQNEGLSSVLDFSYGNDGGFAGKTRDAVPKVSVTSRRADGRPKVTVLPDGITVTTDFDAAGRESGQTWTDPANPSATVAFTHSWMRDGSLRRQGQVGGPYVSNSLNRANGRITSSTSSFGCGTAVASVQTSYDATHGAPSLITAQVNGFTNMSLSATAAHDTLGYLSALSGSGFTNAFTCAAGGLITNTLSSVSTNIQLRRSVIWSAQAGKPVRVDYTLNGQFLRRWQYTFTNGLIASVSRSGGDSYRTAYTYDNAKQLLGATSSTTNGQALPGLSFAYEYNLAGDTIKYGRTALQNTAVETLDDLQTTRIWQPYVHLLGRLSASNATVTSYTSYKTNRFPATVTGGLYYSTPVIDMLSQIIPTSGVATVIATLPSGTSDTARVAFSLPASFETPVYNGRGMILSDSRRQYSWDAAERLLSISNSGVSNAVKLAFQYYPDGRRAQKTVSCFTNNAWVVTRSLHYAWQGWKLSAECERNGAGTITAVRHFVWGPDIGGQQSASLESGAEGVGGLLLIREWKLGIGIKQYLPLTDGLGNISRLIDATDGSLAAEFDYDPYGGPIIERGIATDACPFRHRTRYYDSESWLYYYGYRYYDPSTTKWISKDPLAEAGGWNLTCFCSNDPVNKVDSLGLYGMDMHFYAVYIVAIEAGISPNDAWRLAYFSAYPDIDPRLDAKTQGEKNCWKLWGENKKRALDVHKMVHQLNGNNLNANKTIRTRLTKMIQNENEPWKKGVLIHTFADTFGHLKIQKQQELHIIRAMSFYYYETTGWKTGRATYEPGLGHGKDGHDPDLVALRPTLAKEYLAQLFLTLGGKEVSKLKRIFNELDDIAKNGVVDHPDKWLKDGTNTYAINAFKRLAHEEYGYGELNYGRQYFRPEEKSFFMDGRVGWKLTQMQIEEIFAK